MDVAPYKPTETGYQQQQYPNACPAQLLVGTVSGSGLAAGRGRVASRVACGSARLAMNGRAGEATVAPLETRW